MEICSCTHVYLIRLIFVHRFQEDNESEQRLLNEKIVRLTREKNEQEVGFKKKMESLELMKNSEVSNMKESCRYVCYAGELGSTARISLRSNRSVCNFTSLP